jgi:hypothetical protein
VPALAAPDPVGMTITTIVVVLELDDTADSPSGNATGPTGESQAFHGWLGLAAAIDVLTQRTSLTEGETP